MKTFFIHFLVAMGIVNTFFERNQEVPISASNTFIVFIIVYILLWLLSFFYDRNHFYKTPKVAGLLFYFIKELLKINLKIAYEVITPYHHMNPGLICYPLKAKTDIEIALLANLISLTPGTLSLDVSEDKKTLYFHAMYIPDNDPEIIKQEIRNGIEKKLLEITR